MHGTGLYIMHAPRPLWVIKTWRQLCTTAVSKCAGHRVECHEMKVQSRIIQPYGRTVLSMVQYNTYKRYQILHGKYYLCTKPWYHATENRLNAESSGWVYNCSCMFVAGFLQSTDWFVLCDTDYRYARWWCLHMYVPLQLVHASA